MKTAVTSNHPESDIQSLSRLLSEKEPKWFEFRKQYVLRARNREEKRIRVRACSEVGNTMGSRGTVKELRFAGWKQVGVIIDHDMISHGSVCFSVVAMVANEEGISLKEALNTYEMFAQMDFVRGEDCEGWDATCWARPKNRT